VIEGGDGQSAEGSPWNGAPVERRVWPTAIVVGYQASSTARVCGGERNRPRARRDFAKRHSWAQRAKEMAKLINPTSPRAEGALGMSVSWNLVYFSAITSCPKNGRER
jgi:hypothetical protein